MTREEMINEAKIIRSRDRFGPLAKEEIDALPGTQRELHIPSKSGRNVLVYELCPDEKLEEPCALLINIHGGGFIKGRADRDRRYCCEMMGKLECIVWDVDYILAPEAPFPAAVDDCYDVAVYAFEHAVELGIDPSRIAIAGHSAGGNLTAAICIKDTGIGKLNPCALLMEYFPADHSIDPVDRLSDEQKQDERTMARAEVERLYTQFYCNSEDSFSSLCSPLKATEEQLSHFPDSLVISAGKDSLKQETEEFAIKLARAGVTVTVKRIVEAMHGFTTNRTEGWERALKLHYEFLSRYM